MPVSYQQEWEVFELLSHLVRLCGWAFLLWWEARKGFSPAVSQRFEILERELPKLARKVKATRKALLSADASAR